MVQIFYTCGSNFIVNSFIFCSSTEFSIPFRWQSQTVFLCPHFARKTAALAIESSLKRLTSIIDKYYYIHNDEISFFITLYVTAMILINNIFSPFFQSPFLSACKNITNLEYKPIWFTWIKFNNHTKK